MAATPRQHSQVQRCKSRGRRDVEVGAGAQFERHVEARQFGFDIEYRARNIVNTELLGSIFIVFVDVIKMNTICERYF
jgi:hypothetical protein